MTEAEAETFRTRLLAMQSELLDLNSMSKDSTATVILDQSTVGRLSRMDALQGQQMALVALEAERRRKQELLQIKAALDRIEKDEFGYCVSCGEEIAAGRLAINPTAVRCVKCSE
jgi:DnaK suppressor protein